MRDLKSVIPLLEAHLFPLVPLPKKCVTGYAIDRLTFVPTWFPLVPLPKKCVTVDLAYLCLSISGQLVSISSTSEEVRDVKVIFLAAYSKSGFPLVPLPKKCVTPKSHIHIIARIPTIDREGSQF